MFLDRLRDASVLCSHPDDAYSYFAEGVFSYRCRTCGHDAPVAEFLCRRVSPLHSATLAREFAGETGVVDVPCAFRLDQFPDEVVPETVFAPLSTLIRGRDLLRAIHSPFVRGDRPPSESDRMRFRRLLDDYVALVDRLASERREEEEEEEASEKNHGIGIETIRSILINMKQAFAHVDMFDQYFDVLVPYAKAAAAAMSKTPDFVTTREEMESVRRGELGVDLYRELQLSAFIRENFSRYSVSFEVVHVMVVCYLCGENANVVYNLVLGLAAKLCRGYFKYTVSQITQTGRDVARFLAEDVTKCGKRSTDFLFHLQKYRQPEGVADDLSENFLKCYGELESEIRKRIPAARSDDKLLRFVYQQTFPYVLFENTNRDDDFDYYAFVMALAHFASKACKSKSRKGVPGTTVPKGVEAESKRVYRFVKRCMKKVKGFGAVIWTREMFELWMASDAGFAKELAEIVGAMVSPEPTG